MKNENKNQDKAQATTVVTASNETPQHEIGVNLPMVQQKAIDLATVIKTVDELALKIKQRDRLEFYTDELQSFSVDPREEDFGNNNRFQGCSIVIRDDYNHSFELRSPFIIAQVVEFMFNRFAARKAEIEAEIKFPTAA